MSERDDSNVRGCMLVVMVIILAIYVIIDCTYDNKEQASIRDLQRRVGQLESKVK